MSGYASWAGVAPPSFSWDRGCPARFLSRKKEGAGRPRSQGREGDPINSTSGVTDGDLSEHAARPLHEPRQLREIQGRLCRRETPSHDASRLPSPDLVDPSARSNLAQRGQFLDQLRVAQRLAPEHLPQA